MANDSLEDLIDTLLGEIEESLMKLERSLGLVPDINCVKKTTRKSPHLSVKKLRKIYAKSQNNKHEQNAIISDENLSKGVKTYSKTVAELEVNNKKIAKLEKMATKKEKILDLDLIPVHISNEKIVTFDPKNSKSEIYSIKAIKQKVIQKLQIKKENDEKSEKQQTKVMHSQEIDFVDILSQYKIIHIYGKPGTGKTTFALQCAFEIAPSNTYYFISGHTTPLIQRINQMLKSQRWQNTPLKASFFLVTYENLLDLNEKLDKLELKLGEKPALIVIDYLVSQVRGLLYKEEIRNELRSILEKLMLLAENKPVKVFLINGSSYAGRPIVEDIFESYADLTLELKRNDRQYLLLVENNLVKTSMSEAGFDTLIINLFF